MSERLRVKFVFVLVFSLMFLFFSGNIISDYDGDDFYMNFLKLNNESFEGNWSNMAFRITMVFALLSGMVIYIELEKMRCS